MRRTSVKITDHLGSLGIAIAIGGFFVADTAFAQNATTPARIVAYKSAIPSIGGAVPLVMMMDHYDKAHGIAIDMNAGGSSSTLIIDAVLAGDAEFGSPGTPTALQAIRAGANLKIIASAANNQLVLVINNDTMKKLGLSPDAPIGDRIKALKGLTIGTNPLGATYRQILVSYLKQYGLDPDKDVRLVGVDEGSAFMSGLQRGTFDVIATASGVAEQAIALGSGSLWISCARGDVPGGENAMVVAIVVRADTLEKHKDDVDAFRAALADALNEINNDHVATGQKLKDTYFQKTNPEVWELAWRYAVHAFPTSPAFTRDIYNYWIQNDPQGPGSYKNVDYKNIVYDPAPSP